MKTNLAELYKVNPLKACQLALRQTRKFSAGRIELINKILGLHGIEAIRGTWQNGFWCDIVATYCNTGDTYALTVMEIRGETKFDNSKFIVSSWGDFVEKNQTKLEIQ